MFEMNDSLRTRVNFYLKELELSSVDLTKGLEILLAFSDYALKQIDILKNLVKKDDCKVPLTLDDYTLLANQIIYKETHIFQHAIRQFRHYHFLRLLLRELSGFSTTEESLNAWSFFAEAIILKTLKFALDKISEDHGTPLSETKSPTELYTLAMGKLGGWELNYSSDIDLIFAFSNAGFTNGQNSITNQEYYSKVVQLFIKLMQELTPEGFVFRVDLRLRPHGDSGALVSSLLALETYYQEQGRDWERYAMVKSRLLGKPQLDANHWFSRLISPFVYRRYVDFSVIESLRSMKAMIEREVKLNPQLDDIKRGLGGIREIEFIIQSLQLIRGGRFNVLKETSTLKALDAAKDLRLLNRVATLKKAYLFLRKLENFLQSQNDQQTHSLPKDELKKEQICLAMDFKDWLLLEKRLHQYQRIVSTTFHAMMGKSEVFEDENRILANQLMGLWQGHLESSMAINLLVSLNFKEAERCYMLLQSFRHSPRCRRLSQSARLRLDKFMVLVLCELKKLEEPQEVLLEVLRLLENIVGRSAYLALLTENPIVLNELFYWFRHNPFISSLFINQPFLLENLLEEVSAQLPSKALLERELCLKLSACKDKELEDEILRQFKLTYWLIAARAEMFGRYEALKISRFMADVTDVIINQIFVQSCLELEDKYPSISKIKAGFAIIAFGKLGSREINYDSDLDLVFLHNSSLEEEVVITRLVQKILHKLTTRSQLGLLYAVDTRLRPSGSAGLLVTKMKAFIDYQQEKAWTWEHQSLIRARCIVASKRIRQQFKSLKENIFFHSRDLKILKKEVLDMRAKIDHYNDVNQIKYAEGGLLDLEFLTQFLILAYPKKSFITYTNTLSLLQQLWQEGVLTKERFLKLKQAYKHYHQLSHQQLLKPGSKDYHLPHADARAVKTVYDAMLK